MTKVFNEQEYLNIDNAIIFLINLDDIKEAGFRIPYKEIENLPGEDASEHINIICSGINQKIKDAGDFKRVSVAVHNRTGSYNDFAQEVKRKIEYGI